MSPDMLSLTRMLGCGSDNEETCLSYSSLGRSSCVFNMKHFTVKSNPRLLGFSLHTLLGVTFSGIEQSSVCRGHHFKIM